MAGETGLILSGVAKVVLGALLGTAAGGIALVVALHVQDLRSRPLHRSIEARIGDAGSAAWLSGCSGLGAASAGAVAGLVGGRRPLRRFLASVAAGTLVGFVTTGVIWSHPAVARAVRGDIILPPPVFFAGYPLAGLAGALTMVAGRGDIRDGPARDPEG